MHKKLFKGLALLSLSLLIGACSDSDGASGVSTNSLVLPEQLEVVTNETE
ncbi:hypothetical protein [Vibrio caribbeanicus]|uniref:Uncharacterized protein n=1 Tax=Vibrio caribbeanicus ATCC BAA-2122 TaxID=796620 RepID=E3BEN2_9VIBR|nr:hypothetical protein [Vibrio caribbeanicus]EFP98399.1 hypothetical protein VIBC2010_15839 [Vibrio caribbeanicus ATCC BAA-2122]